MKLNWRDGNVDGVLVACSSPCYVPSPGIFPTPSHHPPEVRAAFFCPGKSPLLARALQLMRRRKVGRPPGNCIAFIDDTVDSASSNIVFAPGSFCPATSLSPADVNFSPTFSYFPPCPSSSSFSTPRPPLAHSAAYTDSFASLPSASTLFNISAVFVSPLSAALPTRFHPRLASNPFIRILCFSLLSRPVPSILSAISFIRQSCPRVHWPLIRIRALCKNSECEKTVH